MKRTEYLLRAAAVLLQRQRDTARVLDLTAETVYYDGADCDGSCLLDEILDELGLEQNADPLEGVAEEMPADVEFAAEMQTDEVREACALLRRLFGIVDGTSPDTTQADVDSALTDIVSYLARNEPDETL